MKTKQLALLKTRHEFLVAIVRISLNALERGPSLEEALQEFYAPQPTSLAQHETSLRYWCNVVAGGMGLQSGVDRLRGRELVLAASELAAKAANYIMATQFEAESSALEGYGAKKFLRERARACAG